MGSGLPTMVHAHGVRARAASSGAVLESACHLTALLPQGAVGASRRGSVASRPRSWGRTSRPRSSRAAGSWASAVLIMTCWTPASAKRQKRSTTWSVVSAGRPHAVASEKGDALEIRPLDLGEVAPDRLAVFGQDRVLRQQVGRPAEQV